MSYKPVSVPNLPPSVDPALRQFLSAVKESLEVRVAQRGSPLDASPTFQDLINTGVLKIKDGVTYVGGRAYTAEQLVGLVGANLPSWVTSDTAPNAPTNLAVTSDKTNTILTWDASDFDQYAYTEVWRAASNNLTAAEQIGSTAGSTYTDALPDAGVSFYYWVRHVSKSFLASAFNDVNGASTDLGPSATSVSSVFDGPDVVLSWPTPPSNLAVSLYVLEYLSGGVWTQLGVAAGNSFRFRANWGGARQFRIAAIDINNNTGPYGTFSVTVVVPSAPEVSQQFDGEQLVLNWSAPSASLEIDHYEVYDTAVSASNLVGFQYSQVFRTKALWLTKTYLVAAVDTAGNLGATRSVTVNVTTPQVYWTTLGDNRLYATVIDNNVLLSWKNNPGSLPIDRYELRRGSTWAGAEVIGRKDGGFTTVFEAPQTQTTYTYWLAGIDTAGNYGTPASVTATVNQPPDYLLATNYVSSFGGTKSNALLDPSGVLVLPVNTTETFASHFTSRSWASPSAQVSAGYPVFIQPGTTTGYYEEVFDYGATLTAMKLTVSYLLTTVAGTVSAAVTITVALDSGFTSGVQTFSGAEAYAVNFRYVKFRVTVTATDDKGVAAMSNLSLKLDTKLKTQTGSVYTNASDTGGTTVYLTETKLSTGAKTFIDVESINVSAQGTTPLYAIYDFVDVYQPLSFKVLLFDSSGTRVSGTVSYQVRGY